MLKHFSTHCGGQYHPELKSFRARHKWLMPVIRAVWEAEIRRIEVEGHPGQIV
jgi:hypothetical protein